jgi:hypothetical protein
METWTLLNDGAVLSLLQCTTYAMLLLSLYAVPFPLGHEGADATSSVARIAVAFNVGVPVADVRADFTSRVSLSVLLLEGVAATLTVWLEVVETSLVADFDSISVDVLFKVAVVDSLLSGQTTPESHAFLEQHPRKPFAWQT